LEDAAVADLTESARPVPVPDEQSSPYWEAAQRHVLMHAQCARCGAFSFPIDLVCAHCRSTDPAFRYVEVSGRAALRSWTVVRQSFLPGFEADLPFLLVDVELVEQPELRMIGRLLDGPQTQLRLGDAVQVAFEDLPGGRSVPAFRLAADA
jgi:uncharacterized protein